MSTTITPYLFFAGRCEEALDFYQKALGAHIDMVMRFNDSPEPMPPGMLQSGFENNLQFPLDEPMPIALVDRIVRLRVKQDTTKAALRKKSSGTSKRSRT